MFHYRWYYDADIEMACSVLPHYADVTQPATIAASGFPRVHAWVSTMEDQSGFEPTEEGFVATDAFPDTLKAMLTEVGRTYAPVMLANGQALDQGAETVEVEVGGKPWVQRPFPYQAKCLQWLRIEYARLDEADRARVDGMLAGIGCEALLARPAGNV